MKKSFALSPPLIGVLILIGLLAYLYWPKQEEVSQRRTTVTPVLIYEVVQSEFAVVVEALGTAKANESVLLTAQNTDFVQSIEFDDGQLVKKGQLLLTLNNRQEKARVHELEINLQEAKRQLKRIADLARGNAASQQLLDEQQAKVKSIAAQKEVVEAQLAELELRAPFGGKLGIRQVSLGALVKPGDVIATLDDLQVVKVDFSIAEVHLPSIAQGQLINASSIAYPGEIFRGKIASVDSRIDPITRAVQVRATIDNEAEKLRPGMLLQILLQKQILNTLVVPEGALIPIEDKQFVFVIEDNKASKREVLVGRRKPGVAQILSGLDIGDKVVVEGTLRLQDGSEVKVLQDAGAQG
jgi:membrane fusion protein (multidrug efflux system)